MAWRRLASGTVAAHLRRHGVSSPPLAAPSRAFSAANPTLLGREALQGIRSRCSSSFPAFQAGAPGLGALLAARVSSVARPKLPGLLKGFGAGGAAIAVMLYPREVAQAAERPAGSSSQDNALLSPDMKQRLRKLWNLLRKFQLPIGLILLVVYSWKKPIVLAINTLLLLYSTRPDPYSIYLFLQEIHQGKVRQNPALWRDEPRRDMAGRNIGVAVDFSSCSKAALRWASTNLTRNGDQLILIHVNNSSQTEQGAMHLWEQSGSPLIPLVEFSDPHVTNTYGLSPDKETLEILAQLAKQRGVQVFAKIFYGDPTKKLCESVDLVPLSCLVIGSRGLSTLKRALMGSVSTYVVNHAACPVTVVKENM